MIKWKRSALIIFTPNLRNCDIVCPTPLHIKTNFVFLLLYWKLDIDFIPQIFNFTKILVRPFRHNLTSKYHHTQIVDFLKKSQKSTNVIIWRQFNHHVSDVYIINYNFIFHNSFHSLFQDYIDITNYIIMYPIYWLFVFARTCCLRNCEATLFSLQITIFH